MGSWLRKREFRPGQRNRFCLLRQKKDRFTWKLVCVAERKSAAWRICTPGNCRPRNRRRAARIWDNVPNIQKPPVCTLLRFSGAKFLRHLNVQLVFPLCGDEIDFAMFQLSRGYGISPSEQFQINRIFQHGENAVGRITQHAVTQSGIGKVEFFLRF